MADSRRVVVVVTDRRLLIADRNALVGRGEIGIAVPLSDIRYVRFRPAATEGQKTARLDITTPELDVRLTFGDWARQEGHRADVARLAQLLRSSMSLPASEMPSSPLAGEQPTRSSTCRTICPRRPAAKILSASELLPKSAGASRWLGSVVASSGGAGMSSGSV